MKIRWLFVLAFVFILPLVSSTIIIQENFDDLYSVGDFSELNFSINEKSSSGFVESYLVCNNGNLLVDKRYVFLQGDKKDFFLEVPLLEEGDCKFEVRFDGEISDSNLFEVSSNIDILYDLNDKYFFPGESITIEGNATKRNGEMYSGLIEFSIEGIIEKNFEVVEGNFSFEHEFGLDAPGVYAIELRVLEEDSSGNDLNSGKIVDTIEVKSKPTSFYINCSESVQPMEDFDLNISLLNQVGEVVHNKSFIVKIFDANNNLIFQKEANSSSDISFIFPGNYSRGSSYVRVYFGSLFLQRPIYVEDYSSYVSEVYGNVLRFTNDGNVPYEGNVKFTLDNGTGSEEFFVNLSLGIGDVYEYNLSRSGTYNLSVGGNDFFNVALTGAVISLDEIGFNWISVIIILVLLSILVGGYFVVKRKLSSDGESVSKDYYGSQVKPIKVRKMESQPLEKEDVPNKHNFFMIFLKTDGHFDEYQKFVSQEGYSLNKVGPNLGYIVFSGDKDEFAKKGFKLSRSILNISKLKGDAVSVVFNRGFFEKKMDLMKEFSLLNKKLVESFPNKLVIGDNIYSSLNFNLPFEKKEVGVSGNKIRVWVFNLK